MQYRSINHMLWSFIVYLFTINLKVWTKFVHVDGGKTVYIYRRQATLGTSPSRQSGMFIGSKILITWATIGQRSTHVQACVTLATRTRGDTFALPQTPSPSARYSCLLIGRTQLNPVARAPAVSRRSKVARVHSGERSGWLNQLSLTSAISANVGSDLR